MISNAQLEENRMPADDQVQERPDQHRPAPDPLMSDLLDELLSTFGATDLNAILGVLRANKSPSPFPMRAATEARRAGKGEDLGRHSKAIGEEILWWASNDVSRQFGIQPTWRDVVLHSAKALRVPEKNIPPSSSTIDIERAILLHKRQTIGLAPQGWIERTLRELGELAQGISQYTNNVLGKGAWALAERLISRLGPKIFAESAAAAAADAGAGAGAATATGLSSVGAVVIAAVAVAALLGGASYVAAGPATRVVVPIVLIVAEARQKLRDKRMAEAFV